MIFFAITRSPRAGAVHFANFATAPNLRVLPDLPLPWRPSKAFTHPWHPWRLSKAFTH